MVLGGCNIGGGTKGMGSPIWKGVKVTGAESVNDLGTGKLDIVYMDSKFP